MKIKDLPTSEQPRERLIKYGVENLSNTDLLSIILRTGVKNISVKDISNNILTHIKSISDLSNIDIRELMEVNGVGKVQAITLLAAIELGKRVNSTEITIGMKLDNAFKVNSAFKSLLKNKYQEHLLAIYLDNQKRLISYKILFIGTINQSLIHPREIFKEAIKNSATSIVIMHNHPTGNIIPSKEDVLITNKLKDTGEIIGIPLIDHIITNGEEYYSFYEKN